MRLHYRYCGMDFIPAFYEGKRKRRNRRMLLVLSPIVLTGLLLTAWMFLEMAGRRLERDRQQLLEIAREQQPDGTAGKLSAARGRANSLEEFCRNASNVDLVLKSGGRITEEMLSTVMDLGQSKVTIENLEYRGGRLICDAFSGDYREASGYLERVAKTGLFAGLEYSGFHKRGDGYSFTIECRLEQGKAGVENEAE